jgi:hypothetical protein
MVIVVLLSLLFFSYSAYSSSPPPVPKIPIPENLNSTEGIGKQDSQQLEENENILEPPPQIKLNIPPPKDEEEAFKRIDDYKTLVKIIPPGTSEESIKRQVFGEYKDLVEPYLEEEEKSENRGYTDGEQYENSPSNYQSSYSGWNRQEGHKDFEVDENINRREESHEVSEGNNKVSFKEELRKNSSGVQALEKRKTSKTPDKKVLKVKKDIDEKNDLSLPIFPLIGFFILFIISVAYLIFLLKWRK